MHNAFIALGSNLPGETGSPASQVRRAFQAIEKMPGTRLIKLSSLYRSAPVGYDNQPDFINAVAQVHTDLSAPALLDALLDIEMRFGRERPFPNAPRVLDLDLLLYDDLEMHSQKLTLPHPRMCERSFVMLPLAEIAPDLHVAKRGSVVELCKKLDVSGIKPYE
jgi:2-amino-4-hydroxy-6-hydroxymethyldihydropteridine diphosphokinase